KTYNQYHGTMNGHFVVSDAEESGRAQNATEAALQEAGYDGYRKTSEKNPGPTNASFLFGDNKVTPAGERAQADIPKPGKTSTVNQFSFPHESADEVTAMAKSIPGASVMHLGDRTA